MEQIKQYNITVMRKENLKQVQRRLKLCCGPLGKLKYGALFGFSGPPRTGGPMCLYGKGSGEQTLQFTVDVMMLGH